MKHRSVFAAQPHPDLLFSPLHGLKYDLSMRQNRYDYVESLDRCIPGKFGMGLRERLLKRFFRSFGENVVLWPGTRFRYPANIELGDNVSISFDCILQGGGGMRIGSNTLIGPGVKIWSVNHLFKDTGKCINVQGYEGLPVIIGEDCWIGAGSFVRPGTIIPDGCVLLPATVIGRMKIPSYSVISGNPAKVLGPRSRLGAVMGWGNAGAT